jgi:hypothetical protein
MAVFATMITATPDLGIELPFGEVNFPDLKERAAAACATIDLLVENGLPPEVLEPTDADKELIAGILESFAEDEQKTNQALTTNRMSNMTPAALIGVHETLKDFSHAVVKNALQIRHLVTNKLILETASPDPRVRIRALELLGKISDVGLFTDRSEVTVTHRSTDELRNSLREKLQSIRQQNDVTDVEVKESEETEEPEAKSEFDLDEELGLPDA